mgnify:CR=1 FL=1
MTRPVVASIDLLALRQNLQIVRRAAPGSRLWAVVKANAYGHGVARVWSALSAADGFALLNLEEARAGKGRSCCWRASSMPMSWRCWINIA